MVSMASSALAQVNFYANAAAGAADNWNASGAAVKWTSNSGSTYVAAASTAGNLYHTNGYTVKAGRIGNTTGGSPNPYAFTGETFVVDGFNSDSGLTDGSSGGGGVLYFELASTATGPRAGTPTAGTYQVNVITAPDGVTAGSTRTIRGSTGSTTINSSSALKLDGKTTFSVPSGVNDMLFTIAAPVSGVGDIELSGGSAGGSTANGYVTWAFANLSGWGGSKITVTNKHTISFTSNIDFTDTNPRAALDFPSTTSVGFLNLSGNVTFGAGKVTYGGTALANGTYTAAQLNAIWNTGGYATQAFATGTGTLKVRNLPLLKPEIINPNAARKLTGFKSVPFSYQIVYNNTATSFTAPSLPAGLAINASTGLISGTPTITGSTSVTLTALNNNSSDSLTLTFEILDSPGYAGGSAVAATANTWNDASSGVSLKWTSNSGSTYVIAATGKSYELNGYTVKGGRIGSPTGGAVASGPVPSSTFTGDALVIDEYTSVSGVTSNTTPATLWFQLANTGSGSDAMVGPRAGDATNTTTRGTYIADIITGPTASGVTRYIRGDTGRTTLDGTLELDGDTVFWANVNDVAFTVHAPVSGTGNIILRDGPSGGSQVNGWLTFAFDNLDGWRGQSIQVIHKNTLSFTGNVDFTATNSNAIIHFPTTLSGSAVTPGFLNLSATVTVYPGQLGYGGAFGSGVMTTKLTTAGTYTAAQLNTFFGVAGFASGSGSLIVKDFPATPHVRLLSVKRSPANPLLQFFDDSTGATQNVTMPSVLPAPAWLGSPLGSYYMYYAAHNGSYIRLAYANDPAGPWTVYTPGSLKDTQVAPFYSTISSPDVFDRSADSKLRMYFSTDHYPGSSEQWSGVSESTDGVNFTLKSLRNIAKYYMRVFQYGGSYYAFQKGWDTAPAELGVSSDGIAPFTNVKTFTSDGSIRHMAVLVKGDILMVFYSKIGDAPERILLSTIDMSSGAPSTWTLSTPIEVLRPLEAYEGANYTVSVSVKGDAVDVNQLRDPYIMETGGKTYLYYGIAGESGIAVAEITYELL